MLRNRDPGKFVVKKKRCLKCPFSENQTTVSDEGLRSIKRTLVKTNRPFVCHETIDGDRLVCRGFYDACPNLVVHLANNLGITEFK